MKIIKPFLAFIVCLNLGCASFATEPQRNISNVIGNTEDSKLSEANLLMAAKNHPLVAAYLMQESKNIDVNQLTFLKSPGTVVICTMMANMNSCSMSFRVHTSEGQTIMSGGIYYDGRNNKHILFRILEKSPDTNSDFETWSKINKN